MITGNIKDCEKYFSVHKEFKKAFEFLKSLTPDSVGEEMSGGKIRGCVSHCDKTDFMPDGTPKKFEAHRRFIDIHYIIEGEEILGYADIKTLVPICEYHDEEDYIFMDGEVTQLHLHAGEFCIAFPEDAHIPSMKCGEERKVKRAIVKIEL